MNTAKKYKKDSRTSSALIVVFALALVVILLLPYLANIKAMVDSAFLEPELFALIPPEAQADAYQKSYDNALLLGDAVKQFYLAFAFQFFLLLVMAIWTKVLLRRHGKANAQAGAACSAGTAAASSATPATAAAPAQSATTQNAVDQGG